jgi:hypothetical protein
VRACELDDDLPLDVCPGCGQDIAGWVCFEAHYRSGAVRTERHHTWPFTSRSAVETLSAHCEWTRDFLVARSWRRQWRLEYEAAHA